MDVMNVNQVVGAPEIEFCENAGISQFSIAAGSKSNGQQYSTNLQDPMV